MRILEIMPNLFRRLTTGIFSIVMLAIMVVGCSDRDTSKTSLAPLENAELGTLTVLGWADYFPEGLFEQFTDVTGIEVNYVEYETADELKSIVESAPESFDVLLTDDVSTRGLLAIGLFKELETDLLPNIANLDKGSLDQSWDPGNRYTVPFLWGTTLIAYNKALIQNPKQSWSLLWDQETLKGRPVYMIDEVSDILGIASISLGYLPSDASREGLISAVAKLEALSHWDNVKFASYPRIREALIWGECAVGVIYSTDAKLASEENGEIAYFVPEEGAPRWMDNFLISKKCDNSAIAHAFLNYLLSAEIGAQCAEYCGGGSPNRAALALLDGDSLNDSVGLTQVELENRLEFLVDRPLPESLSNRMATVMRESYLNRPLRR